MALGSGSGDSFLLAIKRPPWTAASGTAPFSGRRSSHDGALWIGILATTAIVSGAIVADTSLTQVAILVASMPLIVAAAIQSPRRLLLILAPWLVALGLVRRLFLGLGSHAILGDPLLLIEPVLLVLLAVVAVHRGATRNRTLLAKGVLWLNLLALLETVNPRQGGLTVGLGGALLVLVPMLAFWVGRSLCDEATFRRLLILLAVLAIPVSFYGLMQTYVGFPSWDARWIQTVTSNGTYSALNVGGVIRAFSSFSSAAEYAGFLGIGIAVWFASARRPGRIPLMLLGVGFLGAALFLESSRGIVVLVVVAIGVMTAAIGRVRLLPAALCGLAAVGVLYLGIAHSSGLQTTRATGTQALIQHQVAGLSEPFNSQASTLGIHFQELVFGVKAAFTNPFGSGTGSITIAASEFGGAAQGTEVDPSNASVAFGLPGLVAYIVVLTSGLATAYSLASSRRDWVAIAALGLLVATALQWLTGGEYAVAWLPWLTLGWVDNAKRLQLDATLEVKDRSQVAMDMDALLPVVGQSEKSSATGGLRRHGGRHK